jgi:ribosomal protein L29
MQELADSREVAANRRNEAIKNEISKVERDIAEIAATESFKMRVASQTQLRTQCKELKAKIAQLN